MHERRRRAIAVRCCFRQCVLASSRATGMIHEILLPSQYPHIEFPLGISQYPNRLEFPISQRLSGISTRTPFFQNSICFFWSQTLDAFDRWMLFFFVFVIPFREELGPLAHPGCLIQVDFLMRNTPSQYPKVISGRGLTVRNLSHGKNFRCPKFPNPKEIHSSVLNEIWNTHR